MASKIGRNDPCPCNSGKKYKRCHAGSSSQNKAEDAVQTDIFGLMLGKYQNIFRRAYFGLQSEYREETIEEVLRKIKETALLLTTYNQHFVSTYQQQEDEILKNIRFLESYLRERNIMYDEKEMQNAGCIKSSELQSRLLALKIKSKLDGKDSLELIEDLYKHMEGHLKDYRQRLEVLLGYESITAPLVIGVMASGLYYAGTFYNGTVKKELNPDIAVVKKSRHDKGLHIFPTEERKIRTALEEKKDIIVVDDIAYGFGTFFYIQDYFGRNKNVRFSANSYNSPLPKELDILERRLLYYLAENPNKIPMADKMLRTSLAAISQYGIGIDRDGRMTRILPPIGY